MLVQLEEFGEYHFNIYASKRQKNAEWILDKITKMFLHEALYCLLMFLSFHLLSAHG